MTKQEIHENLTTTHTDLINALTATHSAAAKATDLKRHLARAEAEHILAGLEGKNEAARKAELANLTVEERRALEDAEYDLLNARLDVTLADLNHRLARDLLRLHTSNLEDNS